MMKEIDSKEFLWYGLYAFAGFGLELLLVMVENMFIKQQSMFSHCLHWTLTMVLWGLMSFILYKNSKNKLNYDIKNDNPIEKKNLIITIILMIAVIVIKYFIIGGWKLIMEFNNLGPVKFAFQYLYYVFEVILILLTISFGQKFFETISEKKIIPYGGLFLACTWGLMHILTQNLHTGIYAFIISIVYGIIYLMLNKNTRYSYLAILLLFIM